MAQQQGGYHLEVGHLVPDRIKEHFLILKQVIYSDVPEVEKNYRTLFLDPDGFERQIVHKTVRPGLNIEVTHSYPEPGCASRYAIREKIHFRLYCLEWLEERVPKNQFKELSEFVKQEVVRSRDLQGHIFRSSGDWNDQQFLFIRYSQSETPLDFELQKYGSQTFGDMHEDETLFSLHYGETQKELEVFDYTLGQWAQKSPKQGRAIVLYGQDSYEFQKVPTPHRLKAKSPDNERYALILETLGKGPLSDPMQISKRTVSDSLKDEIAFVVWMETEDSKTLEEPYFSLIHRQICAHGYFIANEINGKIYRSRPCIFTELASKGFKKAVVVFPGFVLQGENEIKQLIDLSEEHPQKYVFFFQPWHNRDKLMIFNLDNDKASDLERAELGVRHLNKFLPSEAVQSVDPLLNSFQVDDTILTQESDQFFEHRENELEAHFKKGFDKIFLYNTEGYSDVEKIPKDQKFDQILGLASGFKLNYITQKFRRHCDRVIVYDFNDKSIQFKSALFNSWNGSQLPDFLSKSPWKLESFFEVNSEISQDLWAKELQKWGGGEVFENMWREQRQIEHQFVCIDVISDLEKLGPFLSRNKASLIWLSNVWNNEFVASRYGSQLFEELQGWFEKLCVMDENLVVLMDSLYLSGNKYTFSGKTVKAICREISQR